jgi:DNA-binding MarR family transcriptional regulator
MSLHRETIMETDNRLPKINIDRLAETGVSNPDLTRKYNVDVREFVILACVCDAGPLDLGNIARRVGLSPTTTRYCLDSLFDNGLLCQPDDRPKMYVPTEDGRALVRKSGDPGMTR